MNPVVVPSEGVYHDFSGIGITRCLRPVVQNDGDEFAEVLGLEVTTIAIESLGFSRQVHTLVSQLTIGTTKYLEQVMLMDFMRIGH